MQLIVVLTADYASIEPNSKKLNILGGFSRIYARQFPLQHRRMALVVKIRPELGDTAGVKTLLIILADADGVELMRFSGPMQMERTEGGEIPEFAAVLELNGMRFPHEGIYEFLVRVDDIEIGRTAVELIRSKA